LVSSSLSKTEYFLKIREVELEMNHALLVGLGERGVVLDHDLSVCLTLLLIGDRW
jgi:hypothetical protein